MENPKKLHILFISHTFPPIVGGVETQNFELYTWLAKTADVTLIANRKRWFIPLFLPYAIIRSLFTARRYDAIILGSCLLAIVGWVVKKLTRTPVLAVAHGLDLTWKNKFYQKLWISVFTPSLNKLVAVGNETIRAGIARGITAEKFVFVPNGVDTKKHLGVYTQTELEKIIGRKLNQKKVLLTSGRLARRKGVAWFIHNVMPKLPETVLYVVAGSGPNKENIKKAISETGLSARVKMLGYVTDEVRNTLFNTCDIFIQPNIKVEGDMEGFGISVIEASACGRVVLASDLEGLKDAVKNEQNGFLLPPENADAWTQKIKELLADDNFRKEFGEKAKKFTIENYSWEKIAREYLNEIEKISANQHKILQ